MSEPEGQPINATPDKPTADNSADKYVVVQQYPLDFKRADSESVELRNYQESQNTLESANQKTEELQQKVEELQKEVKNLENQNKHLEQSANQSDELKKKIKCLENQIEHYKQHEATILVNAKKKLKLTHSSPAKLIHGTSNQSQQMIEASVDSRATPSSVDSRATPSSSLFQSHKMNPSVQLPKIQIHDEKGELEWKKSNLKGGDCSIEEAVRTAREEHEGMKKDNEEVDETKEMFRELISKNSK